MTPDDDDLLAGEYVLGSLDPVVHARASARRLSDAGFEATVGRWEARLLPIEEVSPGVEPPPEVWVALLERVRGLRRGPRSLPDATAGRLERSLRGWKRAAQAAMAMAAVLAVWVGVLSMGRFGADRGTLVAVLQPADQQPAFLVRADLDARALSVDPVAPRAAPGKAFELWLIDPSLPQPRSLGVLPAGDASRAALPDLPPDVLTRATYAVTIESAGGSPTGQPTGAPVYLGHLLRPAAP